MTNLSTINGMIGEAGASLNEFIGDNKNTLITTGAILGGAALGVGGTVIVNKIRSKSSKTKRKAKRSRSRKGRSRDRKYISKQKHEQRYLKSHPKRRKTGKYYKSRKGKIKYTKKGQPYIILKSGKARFVKKK